MSTWFNISVALMVFMGLASGGVLTLVLMSNRKQQSSFTVILGLLVLLTANYAIMWSLTSLAVPDLPAKLATELTLLGVSYAFQQRLLFARRPHAGQLSRPTAVESHIPALAPAQFQHSTTGNRGNQPTNRFRSIR